MQSKKLAKFLKKVKLMIQIELSRTFSVSQFYKVKALSSTTHK